MQDGQPDLAAQTFVKIMDTPTILDTDLVLSARAAAWYWGSNVNRAGHSLNKEADNLTETPANDVTIFNRISRGIATDEASFGKRFKSYKENMDSAQTSGNPYESMRDVLARLGIQSTNAASYEKQFGIALHTPTPLAIDTGPHQLMADVANPSDNSTSPTTDPTLSAMQDLLAQAQTELNLQPGEYAMLIPDMPNMPPQSTPMVMIAQTNQAQDSTKTAERVLGVCEVIDNEERKRASGENFLNNFRDYTVGAAEMYFVDYENRKDFTLEDRNAAKTTVLSQPKHGTWKENNGRYSYTVDAGYVGNDSAEVLVEIKGMKVKVRYFIHVTEYREPDPYDAYCIEGGQWRISQSPNGTPTLTAVNYQSPIINASASTADTAALASTLESGILKTFSVDPSSVTFNLANLTGGAVGQDVGSTITLDTNAAGNGWFIDTTPADNSEFLATSNPNEWVAKAGSAAAGKMDMLSVLLHEYGHALGIDHSTDPHDFMGTTLTVGVRRLPSAAELALMQQLIAEAKNGLAAPATPDNTPFPGLPISLGGLAFAGLLRSNRYGSLVIDPVAPQYDVAANAAFIGLNDATQPTAGVTRPTGWDTQGSVDVANGTATLNEISAAQTRLSQVFMLGANDRYLSFTLAGSALDNPSGLPQDAFEVALLDANTGASVLGTDGMTRSDAFLNLQADGTQNAASCVTCINNADGSRTYRVDLTGVAKNTAVNLSFDLLGFGVANSQVTLRDVRVSGLPQLRDDVATLAEDSLLAFDPYAQADAALRPMLASSVVNAPTHGAITVNADGTFSYTPDLNYFGADITSDLAGVNQRLTSPYSGDLAEWLCKAVGRPSRMASSSISFSYRLSDPSTGSGQALDSNLATVITNDL